MNIHLQSVKLRIIAFALLCLIGAGGIAWQFYKVQILRHDELLEKARRRYTTKEVRKRQRGRIFDADGNLLAGNESRIHVACSPYSAVYEPFVHLEKSLRSGVRESLPGKRMQRRIRLAVLLAKFFGKSPREFYQELEPFVKVYDKNGSVVRDENGREKIRKNHYIRIAKEAEPQQVEKFKKALRQAGLGNAGFVYRNIFVRHYPKGRMLANVLGVANISMEGTSELGGLERQLAKKMRSQESVTEFVRGRKGTSLPYVKQTIEEKGKDGNDIYLTIQEPVQSILEEELDKAVEEFNVEAVYAVIADPRTGNILAISQRPNFDPEDSSTINNASISVLPAVNGYEPGSVMKPFTVGKAMDWGVITPDSIIDCGESREWYYMGRPLKDFRGYGKMPVGGVLKKSSNIGTAKIALMMGDEKVMRMLTTFGFGSRTGLPFASETRGRLPKYPFTDKLVVTRAPIGYSVQVSILQLVRAYCALANGGKMPALRLIDRIRDSVTGKITEEPYFTPVQTFEHPELVKDLVEMLISVTDRDGTGRQARIPGYEVAGKTGTAQKLSKDPVTGRWGYGTKYCASFAGFVPARNPELVMVISFDRVSGKLHGGGNVAAPVFSRVMSRVLQILNVRPDFPEKLEK